MKNITNKILKCLFVFYTLIPSSLLFAQRSFFDVGIEGGIGRTSMHGNALTRSFKDSKFTPLSGIFAQYNFKKIFSIRLGCSYQNKGVSRTSQRTDFSGTPLGTVHSSENFNYITIPLMLRVNFGKSFRIFANAGPYVDFLLKQTEKTSGNAIYPATNSDNTSRFKNTDFGAVFGIGVYCPILHSLGISLEVRDYLGLTNISALPVYNNESIKNNSLNLIFGITYRFLKRS